MSTVFRTCSRLGSTIKSHLLHDVRYSCVTFATIKHQYSRFNSNQNSSYNKEQKEEEEDEIKAEEEEEDEATDSDEEIDDEPKELSESQKFLIQYRKSQGLQYEASDDTEFIYKPIPRMPGPSPFVNHDYKRQNIKRYQSIENISKPISSIKPIGGDPEIWIHSSNGIKKSIYKLSPDLFNQDIRIDLLWRCIRYERHKQKHWTWHIHKHRGEIRGSGAKKRPQKGTGKARHSDFKAPQCKNGGAAHGRRPKSIETHLKRTHYQKGIKIALTARYQEGDLYVWEDFVLPRLEKPDYLKNMELYQQANINKHPELGDLLIPIQELDWNDNTKLYYDVYKTRQMLNKWGWLKPQLYERVNDNKIFNKILNAKKNGNIVDILESMPIADFEWDFLKEEDELIDHTIPSVLMIHDGHLYDDFIQAIDRINGIDLMCWNQLYGTTQNDGSRHTPNMGVFRLLKYKKIVFSLNALKCLEDQIGIEAEVERWNYYAQLNRIRQNEDARDAFPNHNL